MGLRCPNEVTRGCVADENIDSDIAYYSMDFVYLTVDLTGRVEHELLAPGMQWAHDQVVRLGQGWQWVQNLG